MEIFNRKTGRFDLEHGKSEVLVGQPNGHDQQERQDSSGGGWWSELEVLVGEVTPGLGSPMVVTSRHGSRTAGR